MITLSECVKREIYTLHARNLLVGVYDASAQGFIGIRTKLDHRYLFTEFHYDIGVHLGTARPLCRVGTLPGDVELREGTPVSCSACGQAAEFRPDDPTRRVPGKWYHATYDTLLCDRAQPTSATYQPLMDYLEPITAQVAKIMRPLLTDTKTRGNPPRA
jgi:hypothetical protein